jgi:pyruvate dehydrogenase E1 component alpha subunit
MPPAFYGGNAIVAGGLPLAVGRSRSAGTMRKPEAVTACFFGDGAVAEGEFHESMNLAALWQLPVLFCCENNLYAMGTRSSAPGADRPLDQGASYGMAAWPVDGMDVLAVEAAAARPRSRCGRGVPFLELPDLPLPRPLDVRSRALPHKEEVEAGRSATRSRA